MVASSTWSGKKKGFFEEGISERKDIASTTSDDQQQNVSREIQIQHLPDNPGHIAGEWDDRESVASDGSRLTNSIALLFQVWMLIDVLLILHYSDVGQTWNGSQNGAARRRGGGSYDIEVSV